MVERHRRGVERVRCRRGIFLEKRIGSCVQVCVQFYRLQCTGCERDVRYAVVSRDEPVAGFDVTALPRRLDAAFDRLDGDACLRPTTIKCSTPWRVSSQKGLLSATKQTTYDSDRLATEKRKAFELLDALTRSGANPLLSTQLHVVVAATHAFDHDVAETVIRDNVNPILKAERSSLLVASTLFGAAPRSLVEPSRVPALATAHEAALLDG